MVSDDVSKLIESAAEIGVSVDKEAATAMVAYIEQVYETNKFLNLTRIPRNQAIVHHVIDSLTCYPCLDASKSRRIVDVGTGAGFPGVPLAAVLPSSHVTLLDSTAKKVRFAEQAAHSCGIKNCTALHGRAELLARTEQYRDSFEVVLSRAVAPFGKLIEYILPLVRVDGVSIAMKGTDVESEVKEAGSLVREAGGAIEEIREVILPGTDIKRYLVIIRKKRPTPPRFPRV